MRLWSLHPSHLDAKGLVALWREGLLARAVLSGDTRGYRSHPQLIRFRASRAPLSALDGYLSGVLDESRERGYRFDEAKIRYRGLHRRVRLEVTDCQLAYEWEHLLAKLASRDPAKRRKEVLRAPTPNPCFRIVEGPVADWERNRRG